MSAAARPELPARARRILETEAARIDRTLADRRARADTVAALLDDLAALVSERSRYFAVTGEHFALQDYDGILVIDALDERLLKAARALLESGLPRMKRAPDPKALKLVASRTFALPDRPVAYEVLYFIRAAYEAVESLLSEDAPQDAVALKLALAHHVHESVERYVQTRERPVVRHFSDIAREYSVVSRLKCSCGDEKYEVKMQALCQSPDGAPFDRMDLQCRACGRQRSIAFDLPYFRDMYQVS
jgi:hypothetical protein